MAEPIITVIIEGHIVPQKLAHGRGRVYRPKDYRLCMEKCILFVKQAVAASPITCDFPLAFPVVVDIGGRRFGKYDADKFSGTIYDALEKGGAIKNDCYIIPGKFTLRNDLTKFDRREKEYTKVTVHLKE